MVINVKVEKEDKKEEVYRYSSKNGINLIVELSNPCSLMDTPELSRKYKIKLGTDESPMGSITIPASRDNPEGRLEVATKLLDSYHNLKDSQIDKTEDDYTPGTSVEI